MAAAADAGSGMAAGPRAKILAAADYLAVAPRVVRVVRDLELPRVDDRLRQLDADRAAAARAFGERWGVGSAITRALTALPTGSTA